MVYTGNGDSLDHIGTMDRATAYDFVADIATSHRIRWSMCVSAMQLLAYLSIGTIGICR